MTDVTIFYSSLAAASATSPPVDRAMGLMGGYVVQPLPILKDILQLRATYGRRAGTFLSNAGILQFFGVNDHGRRPPDLRSPWPGNRRLSFHEARAPFPRVGVSNAEQHIARSLMTPDEVRNLPGHTELLFLAGQRPIIAGELVNYQNQEFTGRYDAH